MVDRGNARLLQALAYIYYEEEPGRQSAAKLPSKDEARRNNVAPFPAALVDRGNARLLPYPPTTQAGGTPEQQKGARPYIRARAPSRPPLTIAHIVPMP